jgi:hypothetical protein
MSWHILQLSSNRPGLVPGFLLLLLLQYGRGEWSVPEPPADFWLTSK